MTPFVMVEHPILNLIPVFGESAVSRRQNHQPRKWMMNGSVIPKRDSHHHQGFLRTVHISSMVCTIERCLSGRSAFSH